MALRMSSESCELYNFVHRKHAYEVTVTVLTTDLESEIFDPLLLQNITSEMEDVEAALRQHCLYTESYKYSNINV